MDRPAQAWVATVAEYRLSRCSSRPTDRGGFAFVGRIE